MKIKEEISMQHCFISHVLKTRRHSSVICMSTQKEEKEALQRFIIPP